jgi:hypothetical protein
MRGEWANMKTIQIDNQTAENVLLRAIQTEIKALQEVMQKCDTREFFQYCAYQMSAQQVEELHAIRKQLKGDA